MMRAAARGAPLARVISPDVPLISYFYLAVPKNARHPNAGRLFVTYMMTKQGQQDNRDLTLNDLHLFPDSPMAAEIAAVEKKYGFKFKDADIHWQATANKEGNAAQQQVKKILRQSAR
jgi:ABC-type Fe3+ transport system substrate-binding protein